MTPLRLLLLLLAAPLAAAAATTSSKGGGGGGGNVPSPESPCIVPATTFVNGTGEVTLCIQGHKVWKEKKNNARTAQVHALINNTGPGQVCDLRVEVEGMEHAFRWWPTWLNTTRYPYFSLSPGQFVSVGAVVPQAQGFPSVNVTAMRPCDGEEPPADYFYPETSKAAAAAGAATPKTATPAAAAAAAVAAPAPVDPAAASTTKPTAAAAADNDDDAGAGAAGAAGDGDDDDGMPESSLKGKKECSVRTEGGLKVRWCVDKTPHVWVEPKRKRRIVRVQAEITNLQGNVSVCGIKIQLDSNKSAVNTWPDWWPESDEEDPLDPGNSFVVGANVYYKKGFPKIYLLPGFRECIDEGAVPEEAPTNAAVPASVPGPAPAPAPVPGGWNGGGQQQGQAAAPVPNGGTQGWAGGGDNNNNKNNNNNNGGGGGNWNGGGAGSNNNNWNNGGGGGGGGNTNTNTNNNWQPPQQQGGQGGQGY